MPVYNTERFLRFAIDSVLRQSFKDFELVAVDDGSVDNSLKILRSYKDPRVRVLESQKNQGISATRNRALTSARGDYVAWLDSDDISYPRRLEVEFVFLDSRRDVGFCHSDFDEIDEAGNAGTSRTAEVRLPSEWKMLWTNPVAQSTVMMRRSVVAAQDRPYNSECDPAEDYDLWTRLVLKVGIGYVPDVLISYRTHPTSAYHTNSRRALLKSLDSNERLVKELCGGEVVPFHKYLTTFGGVLQDDLPAVSYRALQDWYYRLLDACMTKYRWDRKTASMVEADIRKRLTDLLLGKSQIVRAKGTRSFLLARDPLLLGRAALWRFYRSLRRAAKSAVGLSRAR